MDLNATPSELGCIIKFLGVYSHLCLVSDPSLTVGLSLPLKACPCDPILTVGANLPLCLPLWPDPCGYDPEGGVLALLSWGEAGSGDGVLLLSCFLSALSLRRSLLSSSSQYSSESMLWSKLLSRLRDGLLAGLMVGDLLVGLLLSGLLLSGLLIGLLVGLLKKKSK